MSSFSINISTVRANRELNDLKSSDIIAPSDGSSREGTAVAQPKAREAQDAHFVALLGCDKPWVLEARLLEDPTFLGIDDYVTKQAHEAKAMRESSTHINSIASKEETKKYSNVNTESILLDMSHIDRSGDIDDVVFPREAIKIEQKTQAISTAPRYGDDSSAISSLVDSDDPDISLNDDNGES